MLEHPHRHAAHNQLEHEATSWKQIHYQAQLFVHRPNSARSRPNRKLLVASVCVALLLANLMLYHVLSAMYRFLHAKSTPYDFACAFLLHVCVTQINVILPGRTPPTPCGPKRVEAVHESLSILILSSLKSLSNQVF